MNLLKFMKIVSKNRNMKKLIFAFFITLFYSALSAQQYDADLARKLGADERGMKMYVLAILKTGTNTSATKAEKDSLFAGHFSNMKRLSDEGKLIVAGPFNKNDKAYRGLFILNVSTLAEARALVDTDPTVKSGIFDVELIEWYGSAALPVYMETHKKIEKKKIE